MSESNRSELKVLPITSLLEQSINGDSQAQDQLFRSIYRELYGIALARLGAMPTGDSLPPTALVNEAYIKLFATGTPGWENRRHFFGSAARAMRNIIVDEFRQRSSQKRGGGKKPLELRDDVSGAPLDYETVLDIDEKLSQLESEDPRAAQIVIMRFFAGLSEAEIAEALGVSERTVRRDWGYARAWLYRALSCAT